MVFNATFNNISVISWQSVLLVEETRVPGEMHKRVASHWQTLSHNVVHLALIKIRTHNIVVIGTDCIGSCKSNCHTITATTPPPKKNISKTHIAEYWFNKIRPLDGMYKHHQTSKPLLFFNAKCKLFTNHFISVTFIIFVVC